MDELFVKYREVSINPQNNIKWRTISINTGGIQNVLQDIKVSKLAGGYNYKSSDSLIANRFIYWRTSHDILQLSEVSLNVNFRNNNVQLNFEESPILSVEILDNGNHGIIVLIATVTSIHRINLSHPQINSQNVDGYYDSILSGLTKEIILDTRSYYPIGTDIGPNVPSMACCYASHGVDSTAYFAINSTNNLFLFQMFSNEKNVKMIELKHHQIIPRFFSNITGALRGKNLNDSHCATSLTFQEVQNQILLFAFYRDNIVRVWSQTGNCIASDDFSVNTEDKMPGSQNMIRRSESVICLFLSYTDSSEFVILRPTLDSSKCLTLNRQYIILCPHYDLIDFKISNTSIWALWCNSNGDLQISTYSFHHNKPEFWLPVALDTSNSKKNINLENGIDPKQIYCPLIFYPGRFQHETILKALLMFNRAFTYNDNVISISILKRHVCQAIDAEIQNERKQNNFNDEEYVEISCKIWEKFYLCCEQYHIAANQPIGLLILDNMNAVCVIKNKQLSLLRMCDQFEISFLSGVYYSTKSSSDEKLENDLKNLMDVLKSIDQCLSDDEKAEFDTKLFQLMPPSQIVTSTLSLPDISKTINLLPRIQSMQDVSRVIVILLNVLKLDALDDIGNNQLDVLSTLGAPYASYMGIQLLSETSKQTIQLRFVVCRNLLILQQILINNLVLHCNTTEIIRSRCVPETAIFLQSYFVMTWVAETVVDYNLLKTSSNKKRLNYILNFDDTNNNEQLTLLELFIASRGLKSAFGQLSNTQFADWSNLGVSNIISRFIWAISGNFMFAEWLMDSELLLCIEEYVRLLNTWCEYNSCSRHFILGRSYLSNGENVKALDICLESVKGVAEPYLLKFVGLSPEVSTQQEILSTFYLKLIRLFEHHNAYDCVKTISQIALGTTECLAQKAMFQSISFNSHMTLGHYEEAYHALISNCEPTRRKDCLRQLVWCLFDSKRFDILMKFPYNGLEMDFQNIIEVRARSIEIIANDQYDFLYSYNVMKGNMRKASCIMYEKALRCYLECDSIKYIKMRYDSLLCCVNSLDLVDKNYGWIAKPSIKKNCHLENSFKQQIEIVSLAQIKNELFITEAILSVAENESYFGVPDNKNKSILDMGPEELLVLLSNNKMYTAAFKLGAGLNMKYTSVYESLSYVCAVSSTEVSNTWEWLNKNNLMDINLYTNVGDTLMAFLQDSLEKETRFKNSYYETVLLEFLHSNSFIPQWLYDWFKINMPTKLLHLLVLHGRLEEAHAIAITFMQEMVSNTSNFLGANKMKTSLPTTIIDALLHELNRSENYKKEYADLDQLTKYFLNHINSKFM